MFYVNLVDFVKKMIDVGEVKVFMFIKDMLIWVYMVGVIFVLVVVFVVIVIVNIGNLLIGVLLFLVGFCMLYFLGFDLLIGVFMLVLFVLIDKWCGVIMCGLWCNWGLVFLGNFVGVFIVVLFMVIIVIFGWMIELNVVGQQIGYIGEGCMLGYVVYGVGGMLMLFVWVVMCNWMVLMGVVVVMMLISVLGKIMVMWMFILVFFYMGFEYFIVNMFLFFLGLLLGGNFIIMDYLIWNEILMVIGNLVGGLIFVGVMIYVMYYKILFWIEVEDSVKFVVFLVE